MPVETYDQLNAQAMALYGEQQFGQVLDLLDREGGRFPEQAPEVLYLRSCMAARVGQPELSLRILRESLDRGFWYGEQLMRQSPSWAPLQGVPAFEQMVEICRARQDEAMGQAAPRLFVEEPEPGCQGSRPCPLLLVLHGNGANGAQSINAWHAVVSRGWLLAAAQSSQVAAMDAFIWDDQQTALREVAGHYADLRDRYAIDGKEVIVCGFSMGGETALRAVLTGTVPARGFILLGPGGPTMETPAAWLPLIESAPPGLRGYVLFGDQEPANELEAGRTVVEMLNRYDIPCQLEILPNIGHRYPVDFAPVIDRALAFIARREGP